MKEVRTLGNLIAISKSEPEVGLDHLSFNICPFPFPDKAREFFFSLGELQHSIRLHRSLWPAHIEHAFPGVLSSDAEFIYTNFTHPEPGTRGLAIDLSQENPDFVKRFYHERLYRFFVKEHGVLVRKGFIGEIQVYVYQSQLETSDWRVYDRFSLRMMVGNVSDGLELIVSHDGYSTVLKTPLAQLLTQYPAHLFTTVQVGEKIKSYEKFRDARVPEGVIPLAVLNNPLRTAMGFPFPSTARGNKYVNYRKAIKQFYDHYLDTPEFRRCVAPISKDGFLKVTPSLIHHVAGADNALSFGIGASGERYTSMVPHTGMKAAGPFKLPVTKRNLQFFFIVHQDDVAEAERLRKYFNNGCKWFQGLESYARIPFSTEPGFSVKFTDRLNPVPEILDAFDRRTFRDDTTYFAFYISPFHKNDPDPAHLEAYFGVKEALLHARIQTQSVFVDNIRNASDDTFVYHLPNIAVATIAKLGGVPWQLTVPEKKELVIGIAAFKDKATDVRYVGSAVCFRNDGTFEHQEAFTGPSTAHLAGLIEHQLKLYAASGTKPERLIVHCYKRMSGRDWLPIERMLANLKLDIPVYVLTINKTETEDLIAFDDTAAAKSLMPVSGTFIRVARDTYILYNNTRHRHDTILADRDGFPFPLKIHVAYRGPKDAGNMVRISELIAQVFQFSRLNFKSVKQQSIPVTMKYADLIARFAPYFSDRGLPEEAKTSLYFL